MRYYIQQKIFSFSDEFTIKNAQGDDIFKVKGKLMSFGNKLRIYSMDGRELVYIEQKLFRFLPEYHIYIDNTYGAMVKKEFTFMKPKLYIESKFGNFNVEGNFFQHNFDVFKNGSTVASIDKKIMSWSDSYEVGIADTENQVFMLALVIVIDQIFHDNKNNNN